MQTGLFSLVRVVARRAGLKPLVGRPFEHGSDAGSLGAGRFFESRFSGGGHTPAVDLPKTIALKWGRDGVVTEWNATFAGVALDLGIGVEVCWPYRPQEKGSVENLVGWVKHSCCGSLQRQS